MCRWVAADDNDGVLNGPLVTGGHRAEGEGDRESLRLAIEDMVATHGDRYPRGQEFLTRLAAITDKNSAAFAELKREALLANPILDFEKVLVVRSRGGGRRYPANWATRASCSPPTRAIGRADKLRVIRELTKKDPALKKQYAENERRRKQARELKKTIRTRAAYLAETDEAKRKAMWEDVAERARSDYIDSALHGMAMKHPEYAAVHAQCERSATVTNYDDDLVVLNLRSGDTETVYQPEGGGLIADVDLHFDGDKLLFSSFRPKQELSPAPGRGKGYGVFELAIDPATGRAVGESRAVSPDMGQDVDCYDACYLPDGRIIFASTAAYEGVPCVGGVVYVANLFRMDRDGTGVRRLTFDQEGNWYPVMMENGRVMYTRWEYADIAHYFSRILMTMNPDGTDQKAFYGSNSYWPNGIFFARQIPGRPSMFIATVTGHHSNRHGGALCLFDAAKGRHEADGAVQFITGRRKKVEPLVIDNLARVYSPMFYEPWPLSDKYFLAVTGGSIYLVDVFDNMLCLKRREDNGTYHEPIPLRPAGTPFVRPDNIRPDDKDGVVLILDIYEGPGLEGVPRGTVKQLRVYRYEFGPRHKGGHYATGMEAGWDIRQVLGTATVEEDGSASFRVPANTPFAMQPLDKDGKALQLMRSWTVAMPGERLSCVGCHEPPDMPPPPKRAIAMLREPETLKPFFGPTRGFSFRREIQPVLDRYCVSCHDGKPPNGRYTMANRVIGTGENTGKTFTECGIPDLSTPRNAYGALHPYVRRNGPEGDNHVLTPLEFHADTSELVQMLQKGHHNVTLDPEAWSRLFTWADLNAPEHGTWTEAGAQPGILERRKALRKRYGGVDYDAETIVNPYVRDTNSVVPERVQNPAYSVQKPKTKGALREAMVLDLGDGVQMELAGIPAGTFSMGSHTETPVEQPVSRTTIASPYWMGTTEVTLRQYRQFESDYLNGVYDMHYKDQVKRGYYMNDMDFPVVRVSWHKAMAFCEWLSQRTGRNVSLPTEAQWEWACRAGTVTPLSYGDLNTDFSGHANLADITVKAMAVKGVNPQPIRNPDPTVDFELKDPRSNDGVLHLAEVGRYKPNPWGLFDMHGNAAEWTRSEYRPYPYRSNDGRNDGGEGRKVVRGGSWHDRPYRATSSYRLGYPAWQRVYHTGFRVVVE